MTSDSHDRDGLLELRDAHGTRYAPRKVGLKLLDATLRSAALGASLWLVAGVWGLVT